MKLIKNAKASMRDKTWLLFVKIAISVSIIIFIISKLDIDEITHAFLHLNYFYVLSVLFFTIFAQFCGGYAIKLQTDIKKKIPFPRLFYHFLISSAIGIFTPNYVGELSILYYLKRYNINLPTGFSIYLTNKLTSILLSILLALISLKLYFHFSLWYFIGTIFFLCFFCYLILFNETIFTFIRENIIIKYLERYYDFFRYFSDLIKQNYFTYLIIFILLCLRLFTQASAFFFNFMAIGVDSIHFIDVLLLFNLSRFVSLIPFIFNIGTLELTGVYLFGKINIPASDTFSTYITYRTISYMMFGTILIISFFIKHKRDDTCEGEKDESRINSIS
jgi:uncharacterized protein (TIRG00374 family)